MEQRNRGQKRERDSPVENPEHYGEKSKVNRVSCPHEVAMPHDTALKYDFGKQKDDDCSNTDPDLASEIPGHCQQNSLDFDLEDQHMRDDPPSAVEFSTANRKTGQVQEIYVKDEETGRNRPNEGSSCSQFESQDGGGHDKALASNCNEMDVTYVQNADEDQNSGFNIKALKGLFAQVKLLEDQQRETSNCARRLEERINRHKIAYGECLQRVLESQRAVEKRRTLLNKDLADLEEQKRKGEELGNDLRSVREQMQRLVGS